MTDRNATEQQTATYLETVYRFRIFRHDDLPEGHKAEMREQGIDPDTQWNLIASFSDRATAEYHLQCERERAARWQTYKLVDAGETTTIERPIW